MMPSSLTPRLDAYGARAQGAVLLARLTFALTLAVAILPAESRAQTLNFRQYTGAEGLPQSQVMGLMQDRDGYIWFATYGGLSRFDGSTVHTYTTDDGLSSNSVFDIAQDAAGRLYIATDGGYCVREGGSFACRGEADGLVSDNVRTLALDSAGGIWLGTLSGLSHVRGDSISNFTTANGLPANRIVSIVTDAAGQVWVATPGGLVRHEKGRLVADAGDQFAAAPLTLLAPAGPGLVIGVPGKLFQRSGGITTAIAEGSIPDGTVFGDAAVGRDGTIWTTTRTGALRIHEGRVDRITTTTGLLTDLVNRVMIDREDNVWFGTESGASKHVTGPFRTYTVEEGLPSPFVRALAVDAGGRMWMGTRDGVAVREGERFRVLPVPGIPDNRVFSLEREPTDGMLIGTRRGLVWYREDGRIQLYREPQGVPGEAVFSLLQDGRGGVIIGTEKGLARWENGRITRLGAPEVSRSGVISLARDSRGRIWLGRVNGGAAVLDGDSVIVYGAAQGGSDQTIWDMHEDSRKRMWVGTNGDGVLRIDGDEVRRFTTRDGLASNFIWQVLTDSRGDSWLFGNVGLDRISDDRASDAAAPGNGLTGSRVTHFGRGNGLIELEGTAGAALEDGEGNLWFGTGSGVVRYVPGMDIRVAVAPPIFIEAATLDGEAIPLAEGGEVPHLSRGAIRIRFASPTFRDETAVRYRYRLIGSSEKWSEPIAERSITFAQLGPGRYRFEVLAVDGALASETPATISFVIAPPLWQRWWFQLLGVLALAGCVSLLPILRARTLERERRRLEQLVAVHTRELADKNLRLERSNGDLEYFAYIASHDLQEPLRKIQAFSDRVTTRYAERLDDQGRDYLGRMSSAAARMQLLIDALLGLSRISSKELTPERVELNALLPEVLSDLEIRIQSSGGRVEVGDLPATHGDPVQLRQLFQNLIGNALKFSRPGEAPLVVVSATRSDTGDMMEIRVQDNGVGFASEDAGRIFLPFQRLHGRAQYEGTGIGLTICQKIVERHGGTIRAESTPGTGTSFFITLPIHERTGVRHAA